MRRQLINIGTYSAGFVALADQISKFWIVYYVMKPPGRVEVLPNLNFVLNWNRGVTFGFLSQFHDWQPQILAGLAVVICLLLLRWLWEASTIKAALGLGMIIGGALGNVADRLQHGAVVDFIDVHAFGYHWYTFNVADAAIVGGVGLLLWENLALSWKKR